MPSESDPAGALAPAASASDPAVEPAASPTPALLQHVRHESVLVEQLTLMRDGYLASLQGLRVEYDGNERTFNAAADRRAAEFARAKKTLEEEYNRVTAEAEEAHISAQSALTKRIDDMEASITRLQTAIEVDTLGEKRT